MSIAERDRCEVEEGCPGPVQGFLCEEASHDDEDDARQDPRTDKCTAACH
jgi:hypothetical protein